MTQFGSWCAAACQLPSRWPAPWSTKTPSPTGANLVVYNRAQAGGKPGSGGTYEEGVGGRGFIALSFLAPSGGSGIAVGTIGAISLNPKAGDLPFLSIMGSVLVGGGFWTAWLSMGFNFQPIDWAQAGAKAYNNGHKQRLLSWVPGLPQYQPSGCPLHVGRREPKTRSGRWSWGRWSSPIPFIEASK